MREMRKRMQIHEDASGRSVRRMDRQEEVLIWCRKCSGYARQRMGPMLINCCRPEQMVTKEFGNMVKIIQILREKKRSTRKEYRRLLNNFDTEGLMAQKGLWKLPNEEGDAVREYRAVHEENFWSSWLREEEGSKEERTAQAEKKEEQRGEKRQREEEKEENETETVKRRCGVLFWWRPWKFEVKGETWRVAELFPGKTSWWSLRTCLTVMVPDVIDVHVSPSSVITELCDVSPCCSDWEFVEPQSEKTCTLLYRYAGRDEVRRLTSDSASPVKKKDDAACTCAQFVHLLCEGPRKVRRGRKRMECERKNNHREDKTASGKKPQREGAS